MKAFVKRVLFPVLIGSVLVQPAVVAADWGSRGDRPDDRREYRQDSRRENRQDERRVDRRQDRRHEHRHGNRLVVITPRHREYRNIIIVRPHGHAYHGYGHFHHDHDAMKWLSFTAISLKLLDMLDEQAQRDHEAAQVMATTAAVGEKIVWKTDTAEGYVMTTREGSDANGSLCREFQQQVTVGGKTEDAYGTACLQADGAWKIV